MNEVSDGANRRVLLFVMVEPTNGTAVRGRTQCDSPASIPTALKPVPTQTHHMHASSHTHTGNAKWVLFFIKINLPFSRPIHHYRVFLFLRLPLSLSASISCNSSPHNILKSSSITLAGPFVDQIRHCRGCKTVSRLAETAESNPIKGPIVLH